MDSHQAKDTAGRKALGRGLAALIPPTTGSAVGSGGESPGLRLLPIERIRPNPKQPRKFFEPEALQELASSIESQGVLQPIVVRKAADGYEIVAGERRWRAASQAGLGEVPALVKDLSDQASLQAALIENIQRQDLDPLEEAAAYQRLLQDHGLTHEQLASSVGKSRVAITNALRLLKLPEAVVAMLGEGRLTAGHARAIMSLEKASDMERLARQIGERAMSVREAERQARLVKQAQSDKTKASTKSPAELSVEERLQRTLGTKVRLHQRKGKGRIEVYFHSLDELDRLLDRLAP